MENRLKRFVSIVDCGSFTLASKELHISQPALTNMVQKLEAELKVELIVRPARKLALTRAGQIAYKNGKQLVSLSRNINDELATIKGEKPIFNVGCIDSLANQAVAMGLLDGIEMATQLTLTIQSSKELLARLKRNELDIAIVVEQAEPLRELARYKLGHETFVLVCSKDRARDYIKAVKQKKLPDFLSYNLGSNTNRVIEAQLEKHGIITEARIFSTNPSILCELAIQGKGIAALPKSMLSKVDKNKYSEISLGWDLSRPLTAYWIRGRHLPRAALPLWKTIATSGLLKDL